MFQLASVVQLVRILAIMRVVVFESQMICIFSNFPHQLGLLLRDFRGIVKWFGAHYNQEVSFSTAVKCKTGPQVLTSGSLDSSLTARAPSS